MEYKEDDGVKNQLKIEKIKTVCCDCGCLNTSEEARKKTRKLKKIK